MTSHLRREFKMLNNVESELTVLRNGVKFNIVDAGTLIPGDRVVNDSAIAKSLILTSESGPHEVKIGSGGAIQFAAAEAQTMTDAYEGLIIESWDEPVELAQVETAAAGASAGSIGGGAIAGLSGAGMAAIAGGVVLAGVAVSESDSDDDNGSGSGSVSAAQSENQDQSEEVVTSPPSSPVIQPPTNQNPTDEDPEQEGEAPTEAPSESPEAIPQDMGAFEASARDAAEALPLENIPVLGSAIEGGFVDFAKAADEFIEAIQGDFEASMSNREPSFENTSQFFGFGGIGSEDGNETGIPVAPLGMGEEALLGELDFNSDSVINQSDLADGLASLNELSIGSTFAGPLESESETPVYETFISDGNPETVASVDGMELSGDTSAEGIIGAIESRSPIDFFGISSRMAGFDNSIYAPIETTTVGDISSVLSGFPGA